MNKFTTIASRNRSSFLKVALVLIVPTFFLPNAFHLVLGQSISSSVKNQTNIYSANPTSAVTTNINNETLSNAFFISYSTHETNQTLFKEKVGAIRDSVISFLRETADEQVEKQNDTETIKVSLVDFSGKTQNIVGVEPTVALLYYEFDKLMSDLQHNGTQKILITSAFGSTCNQPPHAINGEGCKLYLRLNQL